MQGDSALMVRPAILSVVVSTFSCLLATSAIAYPYDLRNAFCMDKLHRGRSNYENQKIYRHCMDNADTLIYQYEMKAMRQKRLSEEHSARLREEKMKRDMLEKRKEDSLFKMFE